MPILRAEPNIYPENLLAEEDISGLNRSWKAVYTKSRQEKALARHLHQTEVPFFLPLIPKDNLIRGKQVRSLLPLFTNYAFMFCTDIERVTAMKSNRIISILDVEDEQQLVTDLNQINQLIVADVPLSIESQISTGQMVRIKSGAFEGFEGTVIDRTKKTRLLIAVNYLQQGVSIEIEDYMLEVI
ncbi:MAG: antitermination protein NusG [Blastopirellula sp.]|nr:MAG: antitermination protein NusG [Blastopirellula sp.]